MTETLPSSATVFLAYIGLGANLGDPVVQLNGARQALSRLPHTRVVHSSSLYSTAPIGDEQQDRFVNAACSVETCLKPGVFLGALHGIEQVAGRRRGARRFGPRPLDLDLLLVQDGSDIVISSVNLSLPHPRLTTRRFVLEPLAEIASDLEVPAAGSVSALLRLNLDQDCQRMQDWP